MTKSEAADHVARHALAFALRTGQPITGDAIESAASQMWHNGPGSIGREAAETYNYRTAHRIAVGYARVNYARPDLVGPLRGSDL